MGFWLSAGGLGHISPPLQGGRTAHPSLHPFIPPSLHPSISPSIPTRVPAPCPHPPANIPRLTSSPRCPPMCCHSQGFFSPEAFSLRLGGSPQLPRVPALFCSLARGAFCSAVRTPRSVCFAPEPSELPWLGPGGTGLALAVSPPLTAASGVSDAGRTPVLGDPAHEHLGCCLLVQLSPFRHGRCLKQR